MARRTIKIIEGITPCPTPSGPTPTTPAPNPTSPTPTLGGKVAVRLPAAIVGAELEGLAGSDDLRAGADG